MSPFLEVLHGVASQRKNENISFGFMRYVAGGNCNGLQGPANLHRTKSHQIHANIGVFARLFQSELLPRARSPSQSGSASLRDESPIYPPRHIGIAAKGTDMT